MKNTLSLITACTVALGTIQLGHAQTIKKSSKIAESIYELAFNNKNNSLYVASTRGNAEKPTIYILDAGTLAVRDSIVLPESSAFGLAINQKSQVMYTSNTRGPSVYAIDLKTNNVLATITNGLEKGHPREVVVDEANNKVYVSDVGGGIWEIDGKTNKHVQQINAAGPSVTGLAIDSKNNRLFAINFKTSNIVAIDLKTKNVVDSFPSGGEKAINLDFDAKRNRLYIAHTGSGTVSVLDANTGEVLQSIETGKGALGIRYSPANDHIFVANRGAETVTVIDAKNYVVKANLEAGSLPNTIVVDQKGVAYTTHKANGAGRPKQGEKPQPSNDPNGDIVTLIAL